MQIFVFGTRGFPMIQGGVEKHCECLYPLIASEELQVTVFRRKPYVVNCPDKTYNYIRFIDLPSTRIKGFEALFHSFLCTVYSFVKKPDIVHIHNIGPALFSPLLKLAGIKVILTYHSPNYEHKKWNKFAKFILKTSEKTALNFSDYIIFVSKVQLEKFNNRVKEKSVFIPNGINRPQVTNETDYLESQGIKKGKYVLAVGRITPEKGFDYLISAFKKVYSHEYQLVIAGGVEGEEAYYAKLKKESTDNIIFTGYIFGKELAQLYSHAALFVLPSYNEGMPLVLLEAMSYGLPILASDIPANKSINLPPDCYFHLEDKTVTPLQKAIENRLANPVRYEYDLSPYDWDRIAEQTKEVYKEIESVGRK
ncbi:MAG: glycosyltransferase family 4 protein [Tannerella sp.]|jgi:glycosyltransferase involved in cell wall biosynthesis|nr:glycosyltransferase family 4 protein [Tannerella sp.]